MAPEQVFGESVAEAADLYSVGVIFYRVLTGALPFAADTPVDMLQQQVTQQPKPLWLHRSDLPAWCDTIVARALARSPADRFQSASAFRAALGGAAGHSVRRNSALAQLSRTSLSTTAIARPFRGAIPPGRRRARVNACLVAFAACVGALAFMPMLYAKPKSTPPIATTPAPLVFDTSVVVRGGDERAAQLTLSDCTLTVAPAERAGEPLYIVPYGSIISTAYTKARQPVWSSARGPVALARALRPRNRSTARHWLVVRTSMESRFVVLRFDEPQIAPLLTALEDRSGRAPKIFCRSARR
jgi:hypothetical protein